jgi:hypothetical protein
VDYIPLIDVSPENGEAAVLFAALEGAGFDVMVECDVRGWMYWYKPFASFIRPVTIWVPGSQLDEARGYVEAPVDCAPADDGASAGFWALVRASRRPVFAAYLAIVLVMGY